MDTLERHAQRLKVRMQDHGIEPDEYLRVYRQCLCTILEASDGELRVDQLFPGFQRGSNDHEFLRAIHNIVHPDTKSWHRHSVFTFTDRSGEYRELLSSGRDRIVFGDTAVKSHAGSSSTSGQKAAKAGPAKVFFCYAREDEGYKDKLIKHLSILKRQSVIETWHDRMIVAGEEWKGAIDQNLEKADIILLLVSADFLASDYCWDVEMTRALERHEAGEARVIPIILRSAYWKEAPFAKLQGLPKDAKAVKEWADEDAAFTDIAHGIQAAVENPR